MVGLTGFACLRVPDSDQPDSSVLQTLATMAERLGSNEQTVPAKWTEARAGLAAFERPGSSGLAQHDGVCLTFAGEFSETAALPAATRADALLAGYLDRGVDGLTGLNGVYAAAVWDGRSGTLHLVPDRSGFRPLYYWDAGDRIYFGTRYSTFTSLPGFPKTLHAPTIHEFLRFGYCLGDDAFYEHVKLVPAGTVLGFSSDGRNARRYWEMSFSGDVTCLEDGAALIAETMRSAVSDRARGPLCLQLTGGLDSRMIAGFVREAMPEVPCEAITIGMADAFELQYGGRLARDLGYRHRPFAIDDTYYMAMADEGVRRTEGIVIGHTCWRLATDGWLQAGGFAQVSNGWMSIFPRMSDRVKVLMANPGREETLRVTHGMLGDTADEFPLATIFKPEVFREIERLPDERIAAVVDSAPTDQDVHRYDHAEYYLRQRGFQAQNMNYFRDRADAFAPISDNRVVDAAGRLAPSLRAGSAAYHLALRTYLPKACRAPHTKNQMPLVASRWEILARKAWGRAYYKVLPKLTAGAIGTKNRMAYVPYREALRGGSRAYIEQDLAHLDAFSSILDVGKTRALMGEYFDGTRPGYGPAYCLHTLCLWHKHFG